MELSLEEKFDQFLVQYGIDMHGDTNAEEGGRLGLVDSVRRIIRDQKTLEEKVLAMEEMKKEVEKNTAFREEREKIGWEIKKYLIWAIVGALAVIVANFIVQSGFTVG